MVVGGLEGYRNRQRDKTRWLLGSIMASFFGRSLLPLFLPCDLGCEYRESDEELSWRMDATHSHPHLVQIANFFPMWSSFYQKRKLQRPHIPLHLPPSLHANSICQMVLEKTWYPPCHSVSHLLTVLFLHFLTVPPHRNNSCQYQWWFISPILTVYNLLSFYHHNILKCCSSIVLEAEVNLGAIWCRILF